MFKGSKHCGEISGDNAIYLGAMKPRVEGINFPAALNGPTSFYLSPLPDNGRI